MQTGKHRKLVNCMIFIPAISKCFLGYSIPLVPANSSVGLVRPGHYQHYQFEQQQQSNPPNLLPTPVLESLVFGKKSEETHLYASVDEAPHAYTCFHCHQQQQFTCDVPNYHQFPEASIIPHQEEQQYTHHQAFDDHHQIQEHLQRPTLPGIETVLPRRYNDTNEDFQILQEIFDYTDSASTSVSGRIQYGTSVDPPIVVDSYSTMWPNPVMEQTNQSNQRSESLISLHSNKIGETSGESTAGLITPAIFQWN